MAIVLFLSLSCIVSRVSGVILDATYLLRTYRASREKIETSELLVSGMSGMLAELMQPSETCDDKCNIMKSSGYFDFNKSEDEMAKFMDVKGILKTTVSELITKRATYITLRAALMACEAGDIVSLGAFDVGSSVVMMKTVIELDQCDRKFWIFGSVEDNLERKDKVVDKLVSNLKLLDVWDESRINITEDWMRNASNHTESVQRIAFLRFSGDSQTNCREAMENLYPKINKGGCIFIDQYNAFNGSCHSAVAQYRVKHNIHTKINKIYEYNSDVLAVWWRKE